MAGEGLLCAGCGITLRPFMKVCPRCGLEREHAEPIEIPHPSPVSGQESKRSSITPAQQTVLQAPNAVFLPPGEIARRFPVFTSAQRALLTIGIGLLAILLGIAYLLWRQQKHDLIHLQSPPGNTNTVANSSPSTTVRPDASPASTLPTPEVVDDQKITDAVKAALLAYNPLNSGRYKVTVKQGVVTLNGEALHQPEKDGADNVIRLIAGVKSVVNNLKVKPEEPGFFPPKVNAAEANLLDEALRKQIQAEEQAKQKPLQPDEQREDERQRREISAARLHEAELAARKTAEEKLRRDIEEYDKREEELRRADAERRMRSEQAKFALSTLHTGTVAWSGVVDGVEEIIFSGSSSSVKHVSGKPAREVRASFSAPIPRSVVNLDLVSSRGRGSIAIAQQPSAANGYTAIVRIDDSGKGSERRYEFTLRWTLP
jgi:BON domain-containing protein